MNKVVVMKKERKKTKNGTLATTHCLAVFYVAFGHFLRVLLITKALKVAAWTLK